MSTASGILFVISAPSGAGKTSLRKGVMDGFPRVKHSVSYTTRSPREGEVEGKDYHFVSTAEFEEKRGKGEFAEWAEVFETLYGTSKADLETLKKVGFHVILDIDVQGARQIKEAFPGEVFIFVVPPDWETLRERLEKRGSETPEEVQRRLNDARKEVENYSLYDYIIVNDTLDVAISRLKAIVVAEECRRERMTSSVEKLLK